MAAGLCRLRARKAGCAPNVASAGFLGAGVPAPEDVLDVMASRGVDLGSHRSQQITPALIRATDLVITMTRQHLIDVAVMAGEDWFRCFTLTEVVQRAEVIGSPPAGDPADRWVRQLHGGRTRASMLRSDPGADVLDPMGGRRSDFEQTADRIDDLVTRLVRVICPISAPTRT